MKQGEESRARGNIRGKRNPYRVLVGRPGLRIQLRSRGVHGSIILKWIARK